MDPQVLLALLNAEMSILIQNRHPYIQNQK